MPEGFKLNFFGSCKVSVKGHQTIHRSYPNTPVFTFRHRADFHVQTISGILFQSIVFMLENNRSVFFGNQIQTSAQQTDPDTFLTILISEIHIIVTDRIRILRIIFIAGKAQTVR